VFLDRDGTLVVERYYLADPDQVELVPGAAAALRALAAAGYALVVVTNQSGIARGLYGEAEFRAVQRRIEELLRREGIELDGVYHCPHHPDYTGPCECRKPAPGLYRRAARELGLDLCRSVCVGDRLKDVLPARELGCRAAILVRTGYGEEEARRAPEWVRVERDLAAAAEAILARDRTSPAAGAAADGAPEPGA
jgi:D-glycero-D-manno-heptose 1,7-bisphosphate phosphatase